MVTLTIITGLIMATLEVRNRIQARHNFQAIDCKYEINL
jgi:hypothetical protein